ncbi:hypothetical protein M885DRAFT_173914 [Pelagophyceae sp. CCMP2097]|nr:hypothetical protein M885DRAFT_173914 [Pelagophyceae sp. CCMP2097]
MGVSRSRCSKTRRASAAPFVHASKCARATREASVATVNEPVSGPSPGPSSGTPPPCRLAARQRMAGQEARDLKIRGRVRLAILLPREQSQTVCTCPAMKSALLVLLPLASALVPAVPRSVKTVLNAAPVAEAPAAPADLTNRIPDCPVTAWNDEGLDLAAERNKDFATKTCPLEWQAAKGDEGVDYFKAHQDEIHARLLEHGCIWFRGFDLMKKEGGFRSMYEAIDLDPCLDPIHTSGLRKFASQSDAIYDEVNKPSLAQHYIGLHQARLSPSRDDGSNAQFLGIDSQEDGQVRRLRLLPTGLRVGRRVPHRGRGEDCARLGHRRRAAFHGPCHGATTGTSSLRRTFSRGLRRDLVRDLVTGTLSGGLVTESWSH